MSDQGGYRAARAAKNQNIAASLKTERAGVRLEAESKLIFWMAQP